MKNTELESLTTDYGREIFSRLSHSVHFPLTPVWFDEQLLRLGTYNEAVKVQLFRFIDVLPMLRTPVSLVRHLQEYFAEAGDQVPVWIRWIVQRLPRDGLLGQTVKWLAHYSARRLARRFIAGSNIPEALEGINELRKRSLAFTVDLLGEATITEREAVLSQNEYRELITGLSAKIRSWDEIPLIDCDDQGPIPRVNVSVKLSALYPHLDPVDPEGCSQEVRAMLRPLLRAAMENHVFLNFDMESYSSKALTLQIFQEILSEDEFRNWPNVGIAIQAYLRDCEEDLKDLAQWVEKRGTPIAVRLVKGAYWDYETINALEHGWPIRVFSEKPETDVNYEKMTRFLMERHELIRPAIGSHNIRSLARALALADTMNLPRGRYEIQTLYGMAEPIKEALVSMKERVRVYVPYGELIPGMAYLVRRLLENTSDDSFLRASFAEGVSVDRLLRNPRSILNGNGSMSTATSADEFTNEPLSDFTQPEPHDQMKLALENVGKQLGKRFPMVIDGQSIDTAETIDSVNPSHCKQIVGHCGKASVDQTRHAIEVAARSFPTWRDTPAKERADYLFRAADVMRRRRFELCAWELYECAKGWTESDADLAESIDFCEYYAREMIRMSEPRHRDVAGEENSYFYEPRGVAVIIAPWNFPLAILTGMSVAALVTGNTVIMKPAEQSSVMGALLMEVLQEVGVPPGVVSYLPGIGEEIGPTLVNDPRIALISFTGSRAVGLSINHDASETPEGQSHVKRVLAEMGGKNALIIDDDADLDEAVVGVRNSAFGFQGQKCSACSRVIVLEAIYDQFVARLVETTKSLTIAPAEDPGSMIGPVIDAEARDRILKAIESGKSEAELLFAGDVGALAEEGYYVGPHIFGNVSPDAKLAQEEIFGPVLAVIRARDLDHALEIANGTQYALTGGFYSRSPENLEKVKREFRVGNLYVNRSITGALVDRQPFGGFKLSGIGAKAGGPDYLLQFMVPRTITENTMRRGFAPGIG